MVNRIGVDIGGTFTDLVMESSEESSKVGKVLSTPDDLVQGVLHAVEATEVRLDESELFIHGTTAGINSVLERRGARVALITTEGFRDVYLIGRGHRTDMYNLRYRKPKPLTTRDAIFEVKERLAADGTVLRELDQQSVEAVAKEIQDSGFESVAVSFLHSYVNPDHELEVRHYLQKRLGSIPIVLSHEVAPEWREYERTATTVVSAYITPIVKDYLQRLSHELSQRGLQTPVYITQSNGGSMSASQAAEQAVLTLFSGPVGGVIGGREVGRAISEENLICIDMGGTSFDVSLIRDGEAELKSEFDLEGLPVLAPSMELVSIALGGGSIVQEISGGLRVGPESAGSMPGPACYGRGGLLATITDANVVLGRLPPQQRLAGSLTLDREASECVLAEVAKRLGANPLAIAEQALEVGHFMMAQAIRELTVERGLDPRDFAICAFGGAGPLHAAFVAKELDIKRIIVPAGAGSFSAWGMLQGDLRHDVSITYYRRYDEAKSDLSHALKELRQRVSDRMKQDDADIQRLRYEASAEMRYVGQEYSLLVPLAGEFADDILLESFHDAYRLRYGHAQTSAPVEFVALRMAGIVSFDRTRVEPPKRQSEHAKIIGESNVVFDGQLMTIPIYGRHDLGTIVEGPAIVIENSTTILIPQEWSIRPAKEAHLIMEYQAG
ncbi:MAG: hydantoinase/oxoprolinase family protein [Pseudomonadota bacterium]|nr:hydantoinase/oxoprolinase family protein [Pseudomonadota bacterium]